MRNSRIRILGISVCLLMCLNLEAQSSKPADARSGVLTPAAMRQVSPDTPAAGSNAPAGIQAVVPHLMKFSGVLLDATGKPLAGVVDVTFSLYRTEAGGAPLWFETQSVQADELGRYTALLGAMHDSGLPIDLFTSGEVRWLGIQVGAEAEQQPRVLLVSVPYALKAGDAETLGGKPASAFLLADSQNGASSATNSTASTTSGTHTSTSGTSSKTRTANTAALTPCTTLTSDGTALANTIAMFTTSCNVESAGISLLNGFVGIGTTNPQSLLHIQEGNIRLGRGGSYPAILDQSLGSIFTITNGLGAPVAIDSNGNLGLGTTSPGAKLHVQDGSLLLARGQSNPLIMDQSLGSVFTITNAGAPRLTITPLGYVGVGTTNPISRLHVQDGDIILENGGSNPLIFDQSLGSTFTISNGHTNAAFAIDHFGNIGIGTIFPGAKLEVNGAINGKGANLTGNTIAGTQVLNVIQNGTGGGLNVINNSAGGTGAAIFASPSATALTVHGGTGISATTPSSTGTAISAISTSSTGATVGLNAQIQSSAGWAIQANSNSTSGTTVGVQATIHSPGGAALYGYAPSTTGTALGISAFVGSASGVAGNFQNAGGGQILVGYGSSTSPVFRVDGTGKGFFDGGTQTGGADFAESVAVRGKHSQYEPGDLLVIDPTGHRRLALAGTPYSTMVAGIYSTKPGVLATPHTNTDNKINEEVPLAIVGIVPCKVTAQNGRIQVGDLLVSSSLPGYAMKGVNRRRMLGAVVGKALEPLEKGTGVIQVLVTLQ